MEPSEVVLPVAVEPEVLVVPVVQAKQAVAAAPALAQTQASVVPDVVAVVANSAAHAGPAVRMLARELGVDLAQVASTGPRDRVLKEDIQAFVKQKLQQPAAPSLNVLLGKTTLVVSDDNFLGPPRSLILRSHI